MNQRNERGGESAAATQEDSIARYIQAFVASHLDPLTAQVRSEVARTDRLERFLQMTAGRIPLEFQDPKQRPCHVYVPGLSARAWHDTSSFSWIKRVEGAFETIREELLRLPDSERFRPYVQEGYQPTGWDVFRFYEQTGDPVPESFRACPRTGALLQSIPRLQTIGSFICFSMLSPGAHIRPHFGQTNVRLRCGMGLVGTEGCTMLVGDEIREWQAGKAYVFDDSYVHEAWHRGTQPRVLLLLDTWHPDLADDEVAFLDAFLRRIAAGLSVALKAAAGRS